MCYRASGDFSPEQRGRVAEKISWLDRVAWKSNAASFIAGMLVLAFGFGFMSAGTHEKLAKESTESALRPYVASSCAVQFRELPDFEVRKAALAAKVGDAYGTRQAIPEKLASLPGQRWIDDKVAAECAKLILDPPQAKSAALKPS
jgi:hypothetical protein